MYYITQSVMNIPFVKRAPGGQHMQSHIYIYGSLSQWLKLLAGLTVAELFFSHPNSRPMYFKVELWSSVRCARISENV